MKHKERITKTIKVTKTTVTCDQCTSEIVLGAYDGYEFTFNVKIGSNDIYEGFIGEEHSVDLCETCAKQLLSKLPELGIKVNELS